MSHKLLFFNFLSLPPSVCKLICLQNILLNDYTLLNEVPQGLRESTSLSKSFGV